MLSPNFQQIADIAASVSAAGGAPSKLPSPPPPKPPTASYNQQPIWGPKQAEAALDQWRRKFRDQLIGTKGKKPWDFTQNSPRYAWNKPQSKAYLLRVAAAGGNFGVRTGPCPVADVDCTNPRVADAVVSAIAGFVKRPLSVRGRSNSSKVAIMFRLKDRAEPFKKITMEATDETGQKQKFEVLAEGQQLVVAGMHPDGVLYEWRGPHPTETNLPEIDLGDAKQITDLAMEAMVGAGCMDVRRSGTATTSKKTANKKIVALTQRGDEAPFKEAIRVKEAIRDILHRRLPNTRDRDRENVVGIIAKVRVASGKPWAEVYEEIVLPWACNDEWPENTRAWVEQIATSKLNEDKGWTALCRQADYEARVLLDAVVAEYEPSDPVSPEEDFDETAATWEPRAEWCGTPRRADAPAPTKGLAVLPVNDLESIPEPFDFVEGVLCDGQVSVLFGPPNVGKSLFALDLGYHVSLGWPWQGRLVDPGGVLYVAGEGAGEMRRRVAAFRQEHGIERTADAALAIMPEMINFRDTKSVTTLIDAVRRANTWLPRPVRLIVVDTLARALAGGNENAPDDMGALITGADRIGAATGAHMAFLHHPGKDDTRGARGHSSLLGAVDTEIEIKCEDDESGIIQARVTKQRGGIKNKVFAFKIRPVSLGYADRRGKTVMSIVVEPAAARGPKLNERERQAVEILQNLLIESDKTRVPIAVWRQGVLSAEDLLPGQTPNVRQTQWQRLRDRLKTRGIIKVYGENVELRQTPQT
jgi:hypothetical protein